jgi:tripartite-type tricarboxylate transporter receptor subunit TctC
MLVGAGGTTHTANPSLFAKLPYDSVKDFAPVSLFSKVPLVLTVTPSLKAGTVKDLIALAKAGPGDINAASGGDGTASDLGAQLFMSASGTKVTLIHYKGNAPAQADTVSGQTQMMFDTLSTVLPQIKASRLRPLAVTSAQRSTLLPDVPTVAESGLPGFEMSVYLGVLAPAGTPREIVNKLSSEIAKVTRDPEARHYFAQQAVELVSNTPEDFAAFIKADIARWQKATRDSGIKPK